MGRHNTRCALAWCSCMDGHAVKSAALRFCSRADQPSPPRDWQLYSPSPSPSHVQHVHLPVHNVLLLTDTLTLLPQNLLKGQKLQGVLTSNEVQEILKVGGFRILYGLAEGVAGSVFVCDQVQADQGAVLADLAWVTQRRPWILGMGFSPFASMPPCPRMCTGPRLGAPLPPVHHRQPHHQQPPAAVLRLPVCACKSVKTWINKE